MISVEQTWRPQPRRAGANYGSSEIAARHLGTVFPDRYGETGDKEGIHYHFPDLRFLDAEGGEISWDLLGREGVSAAKVIRSTLDALAGAEGVIKIEVTYHQFRRPFKGSTTMDATLRQ